MDTTTTDGGDAQASQPDTSAAVTTDEHNADQVITTDDNGTPTMAPVTSTTSEESAEAVSEDTSTPEAQAPADESVEDWAKKKGIDLEKADPKKLAQMYRDAEKKMHDATVRARELESTAVAQVPVDYTGDPNIDSLAKQVNTLLVKNNVNDFFRDNPEAREFEPKMAEIVLQRPHLQHDLDALYALARNDPSREAQLKQAGGKEALTNLAQKQSQVPPTAGATNSGVYATNTITPENVHQMVDTHDQAWFEKNHKAISDAMEGKRPS